MSKCNHSLVYYEVIAGEQTAWLEDDELQTSLYAGNRISHEVLCRKCQKSWKLNKYTPKFIKEFYEKIDNQLTK